MGAPLTHKAFARLSLGQVQQLCAADQTVSQCQAAAQAVKSKITQYAQQGSAAVQQYAQQQGLSPETSSALASVNYAQVAADLKDGVAAAVSGAPASNKQIQSAFATAAATAAVLGGATAGVGLLIVGVGAAFFAATTWLGDEVAKLLGVGDYTTRPCDPSQSAAGPSDPRWISLTYVQAPVPLTPGNNVAYWLPYTNGSFENWARPALMQYRELEMNCRMPPGICGNGAMLLGLVTLWNSMFPTGVKTRTIPFIGDVWQLQTGNSVYNAQVSLPSGLTNSDWAQANDPIQVALLDFRVGGGVSSTIYSCTFPGNSSAPLPITITVADPPATSQDNGVGNLLAPIAVTAAGGLAAGAAYMWYAGTLGAFVKKAIGLFR